MPAQRFALGAGGRAETRRRNGKKTQSRENAPKTRRVPTCPLHALLASIVTLAISLIYQYLK